MPVSLKRVGAGFLLVWPENDLQIAVDRLREASDYTVTGEIVISSTSREVGGQVFRGRLNFTGPQAQASLIKALNDHSAGIVPSWPVIVSQLVGGVLEALRQGEPVLAAPDMRRSEHVRYRLAPFLLEHQPTLMYGEGGAGKSMLALWWAMLVSTPVSGAETGYEVEPGAVLYLDYETDEGDFSERCDLLGEGLGYGRPVSLYYRRCYRPLAADVNDLQKIVAEKAIRLLVVDSAGLACGGVPQDESQVIPYFGTLRQLGVASLTIAHVAKNVEHKTPFGSVYWINIPRSIYQVRKVQEAGEDDLSIGLFHTKANRGKLQRPHGFNLHFNETAVFVTKRDVGDVPDFAATLPLKERMRGLLNHEAMTVHDLAEALDATDATIRGQLHRWKGLFIEVVELGSKEKKWGLRT